MHIFCRKLATMIISALKWEILFGNPAQKYDFCMQSDLLGIKNLEKLKKAKEMFEGQIKGLIGEKVEFSLLFQ